MPPANTYQNLDVFTDDTYIMLFFNSSNKGRKMKTDLFSFEVVKAGTGTLTEIEEIEDTDKITIQKADGSLFYGTVATLKALFRPFTFKATIAGTTYVNEDYIGMQCLDLKLSATTPLEQFTQAEIDGDAGLSGFVFDSETGTFTFYNLGDVDSVKFSAIMSN